MTSPAKSPTDSPGPTQPDQPWQNLLVEQFRYPAGEASCCASHEHILHLSLTSRPLRLLQIREGKTYSGLYAKGDISITPADMPFFARWEGEDNHLQIRITSRFIQQVAQEMDAAADCPEILPEFKIRDPQIETIGLLLLAELQQGSQGSRLYIESLANVLAVHLIRQYTAAKPSLPLQKGGLPQRQLMQVLDYIHEHLQQDIKLADLAALLNMSQFHFSHQFKQATGITPYQYLLQQRIERAKHLLKQSDCSIADIALLCGFNSHSHLGKQFRQLIGTTPSAYRLH